MSSGSTDTVPTARWSALVFIFALAASAGMDPGKGGEDTIGGATSRSRPPRRMSQRDVWPYRRSRQRHGNENESQPASGKLTIEPGCLQPRSYHGWLAASRPSGYLVRSGGAGEPSLWIGDLLDMDDAHDEDAWDREFDRACAWTSERMRKDTGAGPNLAWLRKLDTHVWRPAIRVSPALWEEHASRFVFPRHG